MRTFEPLTPRRDMHPKDADLWKRLNAYLQQSSKAWGSVSRNISTDQSAQPPVSPPGVNDHGLLAGLTLKLNPDGSVSDYNDDHIDLYPLMLGRPGGQFIYGSRPGAGISWVPSGPVMAASSTVDGASVAHTVDFTVPVSNGIVLVAASNFNPETGSGETNYHTSITDTGGNSWTKLKEYTTITSAGGSAKIVSLWFCLVTSALTNTSTITVNYSTSMDRHSAEAYQFTMSPGLSVTLVDYTTDATVSGGENQDAMSLSGLTGESLFVRVMAVQPASGTTGATYNPTGAFTAFASDHTDSTLFGLDFGFSARGEFQVLTAAGATSAPVLAAGDFYTTAAIFGALQIAASSSGVVTPTPVTGWAAITGGFITTIRTTDETTWAAIPIQTSASAGRLVMLVLATHWNPAGAGGAGATNYHTGLTDSSGGNTWTKLKEWTTSFFAGTEDQTVSLWYSILNAPLVAGSNTLEAAFSQSVAKKSIESYQFTLSGGSTVSLAAFTTGGLSDTDYESLSLTGVVNPAMYLRVMAVHANSGNETTYTPTAGYTAFTSDHTNSTNTSSEASFRNTSARGEFLISTASSSTSDPSTAATNPDSAAIFCAITLTSTSPPPNAYLRLGAANLADASTIELTGRDLRFNAGIGGGDFIFDPLGEGGYVGILDFDGISGSDKTFVFQNISGTLALLSDITALSATYLKLDASNDPLTGTLDTQIIRPRTDATYDIGDTTHYYNDIYIANDILLKTDGVTDFGTAAIGVKQAHYATPSSGGTGTLRADSRGLLWEDATHGDTFVGQDNIYGSIGYYGQRTTKTNSSVIDNTEDATNLYQGKWGSGATPSYPFIELNFQVGNGTGRYIGIGVAADNAAVRDGAVVIGNFLGSAGGGGLLMYARQLQSGAYLYFDETNHWMLFRTMNGGAMAANQMNGFMFGGTNCNIVGPITDAAVDLGNATHRFKDLRLSGALDHDGTTVGFYNVTPVTRPTAYTQTYATATRTHSNLTSATLTDSSGGTANTTVQALTDPADTPITPDALRDDLVANLIPELRNNYADLTAQINALIVDLTNAKGVINQVIDDLQANGLLQ